jgi:glycosyltransferase involved in cell wall biosynthesis
MPIKVDQPATEMIPNAAHVPRGSAQAGASSPPPSPAAPGLADLAFPPGEEREKSQDFDTPLVSIIIPCRNERNSIEQCLVSTLSQIEPEGGFEVIVADGMSDDGTREKIEKIKSEIGKLKAEMLTAEKQKAENREHKSGGNAESQKLEKTAAVSGPLDCGPLVRVMDNPGRIVSTGLNAAILAARGSIIIRMDAHTEYAPDYVQQCVTALQTSGADNVGGPARTRADTHMQKAVAAAYHSPFSVGGARFHDVDYEGCVDTVTYGCWRKEAFQRFGYFDEELVRNQDDEHNLRIVRGGGKIWQSSKIRSWYRPRGSLGALFTQYMQYGYWKVRVIQKHKLPASWRHLVPGVFVLSLLLLLLASVLSLLLPLVSSQWSVVSGPVSITFAGLFGFYSILVIGASVLTAAREGWKLLPVLPLVFGCYHFGYGYGFLRGVWDFVIRGRRPKKSFAQLTR